MILLLLPPLRRPLLDRLPLHPLALHLILELLIVVRMAAAATPVPTRYHILQHEHLLLQLTTHTDGEVLQIAQLAFTSLLHEHLLHLALLLFTDLHHYLFDTAVHLFLELFAGETLTVQPGMLHHPLYTYPLFRVSSQHLLD
jgi:hypothetical protein